MSGTPEGPPDGSHGPHVFVDDLAAPVFDEDDHHHLAKSLRVRPGDPITLGDGAGSWCLGRFGDQPDPTSDPIFVPAPEPAVTVGFAIPKGDRPNLVVQKLTELGVDSILLFHTERSVVRWDGDRAERHLTKLRRVARQAAMQSRQVRLPTIDPPSPVADVLARSGVAIADFGGRPPTLTHHTVLIGPEGGWSEAERAAAQDAVSLGTSVLRAETAAIAAGVALTFLRGKLVSEHSA